MFRISLFLLLVALASAAYARRPERQSREPQPAQKPAAAAQAAPEIQVPKLTPEMKAQAEDLEQSVFAGRYTADVHVRYYTNQATLWWWCDLIAKIAVSILSVVAFCVPFVLPSKPNKFLDYAWRIAGLAVLLFALWMSYLSFGDWYRESSALADRWLDHSREWNELELKQADLSSVKVREEIARLDASKTAIEKDSSKSYSRTMLKTAQQQENEHLGIASSGN